MQRPYAVITGASSGIGLELARVAAADGYDLLLTARRADLLDGIAGEIASRYRVSASVHVADLADPASVDTLVAAIERPVDVLVNNAGFGDWSAFADGDADVYRDMIQVNVTALTLLTRAFLPGMLERRSGRILNVASIAGFLSGPRMAVYYATKNYVVSLSEGIAEEVDGTGVTVTALCPGPVATGFQDRAGMHGSKLKDATMMDSATCARSGWDGMRRGKRLVIPGLANRATLVAPRLLPRRLMTRIVARVQEPH
jgi:short-subunit dehydrogenase